MTKAMPHDLPRRTVGQDDLLTSRGVEVGKYAYPPLHVTGPLLREFLTLLEAAQEDLNRRWNGQGIRGCHADRA